MNKKRREKEEREKVEVKGGSIRGREGIHRLNLKIKQEKEAKHRSMEKEA